MDGQTERVNNLLESYLRHFVSANQKDWVRLLDVAQFSYNLQVKPVRDCYGPTAHGSTGSTLALPEPGPD